MIISYIGWLSTGCGHVGLRGNLFCYSWVIHNVRIYPEERRGQARRSSIDKTTWEEMAEFFVLCDHWMLLFGFRWPSLHWKQRFGRRSRCFRVCNGQRAWSPIIFLLSPRGNC